MTRQHSIAEARQTAETYSRRRGRQHRGVDAARTTCVAAIACVDDPTLVTSNTRDFGGFRGLRVRDWR